MDRLIKAIATWLDRVLSYDPIVVTVELILIGLVIWRVMMFLRGTRGAGLIKGVAFVLVAVYVVILMLPRDLEWQRMQFLYGKFLLLVFVAAVVAFQPELRRALIQIGQARFFRSVRWEAEDVTSALVDSAAYLSRNKIGAVIAVERSVGLGALLGAGTTVDAKLTAGLLNTIFYPGSSLHDMGVIVRNGRIAAAGCQFPLAESEDVDASLGSRHRAALGLAQETDAAVVVVSEETGRVSIACEGQLYLGLELDGLRDILMSLLAPKGLWKSRDRRRGRRRAS